MRGVSFLVLYTLVPSSLTPSPSARVRGEGVSGLPLYEQPEAVLCRIGRRAIVSPEKFMLGKQHWVLCA